VKAVSTLTELGGQKLIGSYPIDMEGVIPGKETILIENGVLKNLLSGRAPTAKVKVSNGHQRVPLNMPTPMIVPGVIDVSFTNGTSKEELRKKLIELAKAEGLSYALIVREMTPNLSELKKVYKVDVNTGKEYLIRSASFNGLTLNDLRKIVGAGDQKIVLNTTAGEDLQHKLDFMTGCPATFITPDAFLFRDIEINKLSKPVMAKVPVVPNPLSL
jgi:predicted Zn-dependent protease